MGWVLHVDFNLTSKLESNCIDLLVKGKCWSKIALDGNILIFYELNFKTG